jgi:hypothetical protein
MTSLKEKLETFAKVTVFIKDSQFLILFTEMIKREWLIGFMTSPAALVVRPLLATSLLILGILQLYLLITTKKRTAEMWITSFCGLSCVILSNISVWGGIGAFFAGASFVAAPWCFLASLGSAFVMHFLLASHHAYQAYHAEKGSVARIHHMQATIQNTLIGAQFAFCVIAMVFTVFAPISPPVSAVFGILAVSLILSIMIWRMIPHEHKLTVKAFFGFGKPGNVSVDGVDQIFEISLSEENDQVSETTPINSRRVDVQPLPEPGMLSPGSSIFKKAPPAVFPIPDYQTASTHSCG